MNNLCWLAAGALIKILCSEIVVGALIGVGALKGMNMVVIRDHGPHPQERAGDSLGNEQCFYFCIVPAVVRNTRDLCYIGKKGSAFLDNIKDLGNAVVLPADCPCSVGVIPGD